MTNDLSPEDMMARARIALLREQPFLGTLSMYLKVVKMPDLMPPTMATDGEHLYYHPGFVQSNTDEVVKTAVMHEVGHVMLQHMGRRGGRDAHKFYYAAELANNHMLKKSGYNIPADWVQPDPQYEDMNAEEIYNRLKVTKIKCPCGGDGTESPGGKGKSGGGGVFDHVHELPSSVRNEAERKVFEEQWRLRMAQAAAAAKARGKLPAGFEEMLDELLEPKVDWKAILRNFITSASKQDYRRIPPNRRWLHSGLIMPSLHGETGLVAFVIDTSGSMDKGSLTRCVSEVKGAMDMNPGLKILFIQADAAVQSCEIIDDPAGLDNLKVHGRGGSDTRPAFDRIKEEMENGLPVAAIIYATDLMIAMPETAPEIPVMWARTQRGEIPFGEAIEIGDE